MNRTFDLKALRRRMVQIDYWHKHRHLPGALSALPIIAEIYSDFDVADDVFILSKGHACSALYAVLETLGYKPDVTKVHPECDPENGIAMTSGSLGHGLPTAVGIAWAKKHLGEPGIVHVLLGDGECQEGTTWEALHLAARLGLDTRLRIHIDFNGFQGSEALISADLRALGDFFPVAIHKTSKGEGIGMFVAHPEQSVHLVTEAEYLAIMEELA